jgi:hypothetical protein
VSAPPSDCALVPESAQQSVPVWARELAMPLVLEWAQLSAEVSAPAWELVLAQMLVLTLGLGWEEDLARMSAPVWGQQLVSEWVAA